MSTISVSVVVVSRGRRTALKRCLTGISQLANTLFEVIVVSDAEGLDAVAELAFSNDVKCVHCKVSNISVARNIGISHAMGDIVAFIDDDSVPETGWLYHLTSPFQSSDVVAAGGFVRGRNGISMQWTAQTVSRTGETSPFQLETQNPVELHPVDGRSIKTEGTNMAFRREKLAELGGFDPSFKYFLDETDLNLRLTQAGLTTAIVPLAEVHHGYLANFQRNGARIPRDLKEIGASLAVFLRKHCPDSEFAATIKKFKEGQRKRVLRHMVRGNVMPGDVGPLMRSFERGVDEGKSRSLGRLPPISCTSVRFQEFPSRFRSAIVLSGRVWKYRSIRRKAARLVSQGYIPSVFLFSPTALFHRVRYDDRGFWEQAGGLFGRSDRCQALFRLERFSKRLEAEVYRVAKQRLLPDKQRGSHLEDA
ncbi:glycosyltransferase family 2 protein [Pseudopelagicola sp. nBUS_20]|uniref:glycosyltransferase family 2 protein n=1 Tax=Pseudopelagicola sp. nBUS_20 TaxID=3395317 RepID=UPI003EBE3463